ncbi:hypothetical protein D5S17_35480 [Pseudonocardiaceae bacterium YIM PH 21723]|nr:hypothetical protein D5S17_35480 [Pseudonocardiaceae bacterium YIM PH 21723]
MSTGHDQHFPELESGFDAAVTVVNGQVYITYSESCAQMASESRWAQPAAQVRAHVRVVPDQPTRTDGPESPR